MCQDKILNHPALVFIRESLINLRQRQINDQSGADPGFPVGRGANPSEEGANVHIFSKTEWGTRWDAPVSVTVNDHIP